VMSPLICSLHQQDSFRLGPALKVLVECDTPIMKFSVCAVSSDVNRPDPGPLTLHSKSCGRLSSHRY
jgi:hypothetical protein